MSFTQLKDKQHEKISVDKLFKVFNNAFLSQNLQAVTPNCPNWLFLRPDTATHGENAGVNPSYTDHAQSVRYPFMVWLILQNKPVGEYVERLLVRPRVRPHRPILGYLLKILQGAFKMNANHIKQAVSAQSATDKGNDTTSVSTEPKTPNYSHEFITEFEAVSDIMGVNRRVALASLTASTDIITGEIKQEIINTADCCIEYYSELLALLHEAKDRLTATNPTYTIKSDTPAINRTFDTKEQAQMFAEQIKQDYPTAVIECVKNGGV